jgi:hypothetical protein
MQLDFLNKSASATADPAADKTLDAIHTAKTLRIHLILISKRSSLAPVVPARSHKAPIGVLFPSMENSTFNAGSIALRMARFHCKPRHAQAQFGVIL